MLELEDPRCDIDGAEDLVQELESGAAVLDLEGLLEQRIDRIDDVVIEVSWIYRLGVVVVGRNRSRHRRLPLVEPDGSRKGRQRRQQARGHRDAMRLAPALLLLSDDAPPTAHSQSGTFVICQSLIVFLRRMIFLIVGS